MCSPKILLLVFLFTFIYFSAAYFQLAGRQNFSFFHRRYGVNNESLMFFFQRNSSPFLITRSSSFSVIHVSVDIKNNVEKDSNVLFCFLSKRPISMGFTAKNTSRCFLVATPVTELFYIGMSAVRTGGRTYGHQEPITRSEQLPCALVTAFSRTSLFLERFWREVLISLKFHKPLSKTCKPKNDNFLFAF